MQGTLSHNRGYSKSPTLSLQAGATEHSFALQYTSLILIILTFIVGALIRPHLPTLDQGIGERQLTESEIGVVSYKQLFQDDSLSNAVPEALVTFAMNHDVHLQIDVFGDPSEDEDKRMTQSLSRSVTLQRHLIDRGVLPQAIAVRSFSRASEEQATVRIKHMKD